MHLIRYSIKFIIILILFAACSKENEHKFEMYEMSEMALLMEKMYEDNSVIKDKILNEEDIGSFPINYLEIYNAEYTDESFQDINFEKFAVAYIRAEKQLFYKHDSLNRIKAYNNVIYSCIACHQSIACPGPVSRIKKLLIK